jgi:hypothetical protein
MVKGYTKIFHKYNNKLKRKDRSEGQEAYPATSPAINQFGGRPVSMRAAIVTERVHASLPAGHRKTIRSNELVGVNVVR